MSTVGNTATPGNAWHYVVSNNYQAASSFTMPTPGGLVTELYGFFAAESASGTGYVAMWNSSGSVLASASVGTVAVGTNTVGGQAWHSATLSTAVFVASGSTIYLGFWMPSASGLLWTDEASGGTGDYYIGGSSGPTALSGGSADGNAVAAYAVYTPAEAWVNTGTPSAPAWTAGAVYVNTGTASAPVWTPAEIVVNTGTASAPVWTPGS